MKDFLLSATYREERPNRLRKMRSSTSPLPTRSGKALYIFDDLRKTANKALCNSRRHLSFEALFYTLVDWTKNQGRVSQGSLLLVSKSNVPSNLKELILQIPSCRTDQDRDMYNNLKY